MRSPALPWLGVVASLAWLAGCPLPPGDDAGPDPDAGQADAGQADAGATDAGGSDAGAASTCGEDPDVVFDGDVVVTSEAALAALDGIECLHGDLTLELTDLEQLSLPGLLRVTGTMHVEANHALGRLQLGTLKTIDGDLVIRDNAVLTNLDGLPLLSTVGGDLSIGGELSFHGNATLSSIGGLATLEQVGGDLVIGNNPQLSSLNGFELSAVGGALRVLELPVLSSLAALQTLVDVGKDLELSDLDALANLAGLEALERVEGDLRIGSREPEEGNAALNSIEQLTALTRVDGELLIANNPLLPQCQANALTQRLGGAGVGSTFFEGNDEDASCQ
jgi:hypothetical protein